MKKIYLSSKRLLLTALSFMMLGYVHGQIKVAGTVIDGIYGGGLPGANVVVKNSTKGTSTDMDGKFSISVPDESAILVFSSIGYETKEEKVGSRTIIDLTLKRAVTVIEEVVKMGYGVQKKTDVTGAVTQLGGDDLADRPVVGVDQVMQGKAAGVQVTSNSGSPGGNSMVSIRGIGTINNANPLYVVDGIPQSGDNAPKINPSEIKSISVLKDASACAIYGSRAANGVVLITTKEGKAGKKSKDCEGSTSGEISFDAYYGIQNAWKTIDVTNASEYYSLFKKNDNPLPSDIPSYVDTTGTGTNWQDEIFNPAKIERYTLGWETGSENSSIRLSGSYFNQEGLIKYSGYKQFTFGGKASHELKKWLSIRETFGFSTDERRTTQDGTDFYGNIIDQALVADPTIPTTDASMVNDSNKIGFTNGVFNSQTTNPLATLEYLCKNQKTDGLGSSGTFSVDLKPIKGLVVNSIVGANNYNSVYSNYIPMYYQNPNFQSTTDKSGSKHIDHYTENVSKGYSMTWTTTATYSTEFRSRKDSNVVNHTLSAMVGHEVYYNFSEANNFEAYNLNSAAATYPHLSERDTITTSGSANDETMVSELFRVNYGLFNKLLLTGNMRVDRSSKFKKENRTGYFPSFSAGVKISDFAFFKDNEKLKNINELKVRAGYGEIGNQNISSNIMQAWSTSKQYRSYSFGGNTVTGSSLVGIGNSGDQLSNPDVKWETTTQFNAGIDVGVWQNKVTFTVDYFNKQTSDMLVPITLPSYAGGERSYDITGNSSMTVNAGSIQNTGCEASAAYRGEIKSKKKFTYELGGNITYVVNKVKNLESETGIYGPALGGKHGKETACLTYEGYSIAQFYGYQVDGVYETQAEANAGPIYGSNQNQPGDFKFRDINGDGKIDEKDKVFLGSPLPKFSYGFYVSGTYWLFDYNVAFQGSYGNKILNLMRYYTDGNTYFNYSTRRLNAWSEENTSSSEPRYGNDALNYDVSMNSEYVEDGSYLRLKDVVIGFSMPESVLKKLKINKLRIYGEIQNALTWTNYSGFDPEIGKTTNSDGTPEIGVDRGTYPQSRTFLCGVNFAF